MKNVFILLLLSIFIFSCTKKEEENDGFLILGTAPIFPPFSYRSNPYTENDENITGFDIGLATEIANRRGKKLKIKTMYFDELIPALQNGDVDIVMSAMSITEERKELVDFSITYYEASQVVVIRNDDKTFDNIRTKEALGENKKLASLLGSTGSVTANKIAKNNIVSELKTWELAIEELLNENVDAIIVDKAPAKIFVTEHPNKLISLSSIEFDTEYYSVAVAKTNRELLASVNDTISKLVNSGDYINMVEKYIDGYNK